MLTAIHPKLPMRHKKTTQDWYARLGFTPWGAANHPEYLMLEKSGLQVHFFLHPTLNPLENYGQIYLRTDDIQALYRQYLASGISIHPNGALSHKPWGQWEFALLDPDHNLLTFGQAV